MDQPTFEKSPQVIFLDAVGTLFGVRGSVGDIYSQLAQRFGVEVSAHALNQAFLQSFRQAGLPAFPGLEATEIPQQEFQWWQAIAAQTFQQAGVFDQFADFSHFFKELFAHFATADPWFVYPDVRPALETWQAQGIELGILSNFDSRIYAVLKALGLAEFFSSVTISTEAGSAKPDSQIFQLALQKHNCSPEEAWHIGDSFQEDYQGANAVGLKAIWLRRTDLVPLRSQAKAVSAQSPVPPASQWVVLHPSSHYAS